MDWAPTLARRRGRCGSSEGKSVTQFTGNRVHASRVAHSESSDREDWKPRLFPRAKMSAAGQQNQLSSLGYSCSGVVRLRSREAIKDKENLESAGNVSVSLRPRRGLGGDTVLLRESKSVADGVETWFRAESRDGMEGTVSDGQLLESSANRGGRVYYKGALQRGSTEDRGVSEGTSQREKRRKRRRSRREKPSTSAKDGEQPKRPKPNGMTARVPEVYRVDDGDTSACDSSPAMSPVSGVASIAEVMDSLGAEEDHSRAANSKGTAVLKIGDHVGVEERRGFDPSRVKVDGECLAITRWEEEHGQVVGLSWQERPSYANGRYPRGPLRGGMAMLLSSPVYRGEAVEIILAEVKVEKFNALLGIGLATESVSRTFPTRPVGDVCQGILDGRSWFIVNLTVDGHISVASHNCPHSYLGRMSKCRFTSGDVLVIRYLPGRVEIGRRGEGAWLAVVGTYEDAGLVPVVKLCGAVTQADILPPIPFFASEGVPLSSTVFKYNWK